MEKDRQNFIPKTILEWLTAICLFAGIIASVYGSVLKPYNSMASYTADISEIKSTIGYIQKDLETLKEEVIYLRRTKNRKVE